jgi:hypothetical protein
VGGSDAAAGWHAVLTSRQRLSQSSPQVHGTHNMGPKKGRAVAECLDLSLLPYMMTTQMHDHAYACMLLACCHYQSINVTSVAMRFKKNSCQPFTEYHLFGHFWFGMDHMCQGGPVLAGWRVAVSRLLSGLARRADFKSSIESIIPASAGQPQHGARKKGCSCCAFMHELRRTKIREKEKASGFGYQGVRVLVIAGAAAVHWAVFSGLRAAACVVRMVLPCRACTVQASEL